MMFNHQKTYLNQITMIQSECQPKKKPNNLSTSSLIRKSPLRDRQNKINLGNTPNRNSKISLSPLRSRRNDSSNTVRSNFAKKKQNDNYDCINHACKGAKYMIESQEQTMYYCQKCAILLASQGFKVIKITGNQIIENNSRRQEIDEFLCQLQVTLSNLIVKDQQYKQNVIGSQQQYEQQMHKIEQYYIQFYQIIDQHKRRVQNQLKQQYQQTLQSTKKYKEQLIQAINDSKVMKDDILSSLNTIILTAEEEQYRPVMNVYKDNLRSFRNIVHQTIPKPPKLRKLCFKDTEKACQALDRGLHVEWQNQDKQEPNYSSKVSQGSENPVECVQTDQKFNKSSLKELGGLFCSFDE